MITEGLIGSHAGRMWLCGILAFLGLLLSGALTLGTHLRKGLPLTTQTNRVTGVKEHGLLRWMGTFLAIFTGPWLLLMVAMTATHYTLIAVRWTGDHWFVLPIAATLAAVVVTVWVLIHRDARGGHQTDAQLAALPESAPAAIAPTQGAVGWSMPQDIGQWDAR